MRKFLVCILTGLVSFLNAQSSDNYPPSKEDSDYKFWEICHDSWYIGAGGLIADSFWATSSNTYKVEIADVESDLNKTFNTKGIGSGYQIFAGYNVNPLISYEMKFYQVVRPYEFQSQSKYELNDPLHFTRSSFVKVKQLAFGPTTIFSIPTSPYFTPFFKGGIYAFHHQIERITTKSTGTTVPASSGSCWVMRLIIGYGIKAEVYDHVGLRLDYEWITNPNTGGRPLMSNLSFSAYFNW